MNEILECQFCSINKNNIGARYIDINYCPFCGRKLSDD